jgi:DNA-binding winged helix-turn-helix (wHTH) protein/TolB-like protein
MVSQGLENNAKVQRMNAETSPRLGAGPREPDPPLLSGEQCLRFDGFEFDERRGELRRTDGRCVHLRPRVEALLRLFLAQPGRLIGRDELITALWPSTVVTEDSLVQCIGELRTSLDDRDQRIVQTVRGRGYRWESRVERVVRSGTGDGLDLVPGAEGTGEGDPRGDGSASRVSIHAPRRKRARIAGVAAAVVALTALIVGLRYPPNGDAVNIDAAIAALGTVAVMPFAADSRDPNGRYLADQFCDAVAAQFATRRGMRGLGRVATSPYADSTPETVARQLKATLMLTGQLARPGEDRVAIDVQLLATADGSVVWSRHLEASPEDAAARAELGQLVVNAVRNRPGASQVDVSSLAIPEAAKLTLLGWKDLDTGAAVADLRRARSRFEKALRADPGSILASNGLAASYGRELAHPDNALTTEQLAVYEETTERNRAMAPDDPTALLIWGDAQIQRGKPELAIPALEKAIVLVPSYPKAYLSLAQAKLLTGHAQDVQALADKAIARGEGDPRRVSGAYLLAAEAAVLLSNDEKASVLARQSFAASPANAEAIALLAAIAALEGHDDLAAQEMAEFLKRRPKASLASYDRTRASTDQTYVEQRARLYAGLQKAGLPLH